jgi:hypothetical protein
MQKSSTIKVNPLEEYASDAGINLPIKNLLKISSIFLATRIK